jgi:hypothetical protein
MPPPGGRSGQDEDGTRHSARVMISVLTLSGESAGRRGLNDQAMWSGRRDLLSGATRPERPARGPELLVPDDVPEKFPRSV